MVDHYRDDQRGKSQNDLKWTHKPQKLPFWKDFSLLMITTPTIVNTDKIEAEYQDILGDQR